jgi:flagellin-like protein
MKTISLKQNKKGVSPIIATLLLIVIAVAAAVVTYAFVTGFIGTATTNANQPGQMSVDSYQITGPNAVIAYVRNTGTKNLNVTTAYLDGLIATGIPATGVPLSTGIVGTLTLGGGVNLDNGASHTLRIVAADGTQVSISIVKTS